VDSSKLARPGEPAMSVHDLFGEAKALGFESVLVRSVLDLDPALDPGALREIRAHADGLGLHLEAGVGKVNPYMTAEMPEVRGIGGGDYVAGMVRMIEACASIGITEVWTATAFWKREYAGRWQYDRFRTDAPWTDQLAATTRLVAQLRPVLLATGVHLNIETHEEITSHEVLRIVDAVGPDVVGITFDVANVAVRGEDPVAAAARCREVTRMTHLRDILLLPTDQGFDRYVVPIGAGVLDWPALLEILLGAPAMALTVEGWEASGLRSRKPVDLDDPAWLAGHPDLDGDEVAHLRHLAAEGERRAAGGSGPTATELCTPGDPRAFLAESRAALDSLLAGVHR
jgi:sugar phosphate isomerase/epimerase